MKESSNLHSLFNTALIVVLGFYLFQLSTDLQITRTQIDNMRVESAMNVGAKPNLDEFQKKFADKITKIEGAVLENRQEMANFQDKTTQVLRRLAEKLRTPGSAPDPQIDSIMRPSSGSVATRDPIVVAIEPGAPSLLEFPDEITGIDMNPGSTVSMQKFGRALVLFGGAFVNEEKDGAKIQLRSGESIPLKVRLSSADVDRMITGKLMKMGSRLVMQPGRQEVKIYLSNGAQTVIRFSEKVLGGLKRKSAPLTLKNDNTNLAVGLTGTLDPKGESVVVVMTAGTYRAIRIMPASLEHQTAPQVDFEALATGGGVE
jgi:hypothetical protein